MPLAATGVSEIEGGWLFHTNFPRVFTLFRFDAHELRRGMLIYRAETRSRGAGTSAYLEMWCRIPGHGTFFAKGTHDTITGYRRWRASEIPFFISSDHSIEDVTLNLTFDEPGAVEMRNVELAWRATPGLLSPRHAPKRALHLSWQVVRFALLTVINSILILGQLVLSTVLGGSDKLFTWWPRKKGPKIGRMTG